MLLLSRCNFQSPKSMMPPGGVGEERAKISEEGLTEKERMATVLPILFPTLLPIMDTNSFVYRVGSRSNPHLLVAEYIVRRSIGYPSERSGCSVRYGRPLDR
jgi:hypothetical protein